MGAEAFIAKAEIRPHADERICLPRLLGDEQFHHRGHAMAEARASAESNTLQTRYAREAARFDGVETDPGHPPEAGHPEARHHAAGARRAKARRRSSRRSTRVSNRPIRPASSATRARMIALDDAEEILRTSRDPDELKAVWEGWHGISPPMQDDYARLVSHRQRRRARARLQATPASSGAPGTTWSPTPSPRRPTRCGRRSSRSTTICTATCAAG